LKQSWEYEKGDSYCLLFQLLLVIIQCYCELCYLSWLFCRFIL